MRQQLGGSFDLLDVTVNGGDYEQLFFNICDQYPNQMFRLLPMVGGTFRFQNVMNGKEIIAADLSCWRQWPDFVAPDSLSVTAVDPWFLSIGTGGTLTITGTGMWLIEDGGVGTGQVYLHDVTHGSYYYADSYTMVSDTEITATWDWSAPLSGPEPGDDGDVMDLYVSDSDATVNYAILPNALTVMLPS